MPGRTEGGGDGARRTARGWRLLLGGGEASAVARYASALALGALALLTVRVFGPELQAYRVLVFFGAVVLAGLRGGAGPGFVTLLVCAVAYRAEIGSTDVSQWLEEPDPVHRLLFFAGFAALGVWAATALRQGYRHSHERRRRAEARADAQRIAAELGVRALAESDLDQLLRETLVAAQRALRCDAVTLLELLPDGDAVRLRDVAGPAQEAIGHAFAPADAPLAFHALTTRMPVVIDDLRDRPQLASPALLRHGIVSSTVAPILAPGPGGRAFGVLGAHRRAHRPFGNDDVSFLQTAANVVGTAVVRLRSEERVRRSLANERFLAEASRQLALSIEWQETLGRVAQLAVPFLGDWSLVVVLAPDGTPRSVAVKSADPARALACRELLERYPIDLTAQHGVGRILRTGSPELIPEIGSDAFVLGDGPQSGALRRELLERLGLRSYMGAPLAVGDRVLGAIAFGVSDGPRRYGPDDLALAQALAQRCAVALENARLYRAAQEASRARDEVLAIVSHDLKTPLGALTMGAQMVARLAPEGQAGDELRRAATTVRRAADRMGRLIRDLVDVASMDAGRLSLELREQDAAAIARELVDGLQPLAAERAVALAVDAATPLPVRADRDRLHQVLSNLVANALQVTAAGGRVDVAVRRADGEVVFTVTDTGPGIPSEDLPHLFERWYRGRRARYPGSGLGLAIARAIVEAHGGRIWVESREGEGSAFSFALPAEAAAATARTG